MHWLPLSIFPLFLLAVSAALMMTHVKAWRDSREEVLDEDERTFRWRQFRRRMQTSAMVGLLAIGVFVGQVLPWEEWPRGFVYYWCGVFLVVLWMALLAGADVLASRHHLSRKDQRALLDTLRRAPPERSTPKPPGG